jgi:ATP-dependent DNA ligase
LLVIDRGAARAFTRRGSDWTYRYRPIVAAARRLPCRAAIIDGEVIVQDESGISDFGALRSAIDDEPHRLLFYAFDLLHLDGKDLRQAPWSSGERRFAGCSPAATGRSISVITRTAAAPTCSRRPIVWGWRASAG